MYIEQSVCNLRLTLRTNQSAHGGAVQTPRTNQSVHGRWASLNWLVTLWMNGLRGLTRTHVKFVFILHVHSLALVEAVMQDIWVGETHTTPMSHSCRDESNYLAQEFHCLSYRSDCPQIAKELCKGKTMPLYTRVELLHIQISAGDESRMAGDDDVS
jgi:hypothetical protein